MPERAIALAEFGIRNNPNEWRLYYDLGFIYYTDVKDYAKAADAFERGSHVPKAHPFLKLLAAQMAEHAGEVQTARMLWQAYETSEDKNIRANAIAHLRALKVDETVPKLENLVALYKQKTGRRPTDFSEMAKAGMFPGIPLDPLGVPYRLSAEGRAEVQDPDNLPFIEKGIPQGYVPPKKPKFLPSD